MAVAKVILNDVSQIDLTSDTVTAESLLSGFTAHDASGTQITGTASGGGVSHLIDTVVVSENTRALNLDMTPYASYDWIIAFVDTLEVGPSSDWIYVAANASSATGGSYTEKLSSLQGTIFIRTRFAGVSKDSFIYPASATVAGVAPTDVTSGLTNVYIYAYDSNKYIKAGSTLKIYGGTYTDI